MAKVELEFGGGVETLLSHMALLGAALIAEDAGLQRVRLWWSDAPRPVPHLEYEGDGPEDLAKSVRTLAQRLAAEHSWTHARVETGAEGKPLEFSTLFNGRTKTPQTAEAWEEVEQKRATGFTEMQSPLERELARSLGRQAWWFVDAKPLKPASGANNWEMRARNQGLEFLDDRFIPLAREVSSWGDEQIVDGLCGRTVNDVIGKNQSDSRTATGFTELGATDNAVAFCALVALAAPTVMHRVKEASASAAFVARRGNDLGVLLMPVAAMPVTPRRLVAVMRSRELIEHGMAFRSEAGDEDATTIGAGRRLASWGMIATVAFAQWVSDNKNAPERKALTGRVIPCGRT